MFFSPAFLTPAYFGVYPGTGLPAIADDLVAAIFGRLQARLVDSGTLAWAGTGMAEDDQALPYATIGEVGEDASYQSAYEDGSAPYDDEARVPITVFAATSSAAGSLARAVSKALNDAPLALADGELLYLRRLTGNLPALDPDEGPGGVNVWVSHLIFKAITAKST